MYIRCKVCNGAIRCPSNHLTCAICKSFCHKNCANGSSSPFYCNDCLQNIFPFHNIDNNDLEQIFDMDIHDLVNIIDNVDWDERLPETREKVETCEYYNMLEYRDLLSNAHKTDFLLLHMNIVSLISKQSKLENILHLSEKMPDVIALSETKIRIADNVQDAYNIYFYDFVHRDTPTHFGGVGFYNRESLDFVVRKLPKTRFSHFCEEKFKKDLEENLQKINFDAYDPNTATEVFNENFQAVIENMHRCVLPKSTIKRK